MYERATEALAGEGALDLWSERELPPLPPMNVEQAMVLFRRMVRREQLGEHWGRLASRKRWGPLSSQEIAIERRIWWTADREEQAAEARRQARGVARARHYEETGNWFLPGEEVPDALGSGGADVGRE